jgi:hypothetical protein
VTKKERLRMRPEIEERLQEVYASGYLNQPKSEALYGDGLWRRLLRALHAVVAEHPRFVLNEGMSISRDKVYQVAVTEAAYPSLWKDWIGGSNLVRTAWLDANGGTYPVLWLDVSRVWPASAYYFNLWQKRGDTGYLDADVAHAAPDDGWAAFLAALTAALCAAGIQSLAREELREAVPFVVDLVWSDDDNDDDDSEPAEEPSTLGQCLFHDD